MIDNPPIPELLSPASSLLQETQYKFGYVPHSAFLSFLRCGKLGMSGLRTALRQELPIYGAGVFSNSNVTISSIIVPLWAVYLEMGTLERGWCVVVLK